MAQISPRFVSSLVCIGLAALTLIAFWPVSHCGFINYDDPDYVTENPHVQAGISLATIQWAFRTTEASNWHPLTWLSHTLDWRLFGAKATGHHLMSLGIHVANSLLVFWIFRALTGALWRPAAVAALFALHPAHVESVAWISERKDVLSGLFFLLTLWMYARYVACGLQIPGSKVQTPLSSQRGKWAWYMIALVLFAFGLMSKPMLVTTPFILLLLDYWPLGRVRGPLSKLPSAEYELRTVLLEKLPFLLLSIASCAITVSAQSLGGAIKDILPLLARVENAAVAYMRYAGLAICPAELSIIYPHPGQWPIAIPVISACLVLALSTVATILRRNHPYIFVGWFWFVGMLVPVIGLVQVGFQSIADRYTYLPFIGLFIVVVWAAGELIHFAPHVSRFRLHFSHAAIYALIIGLLAACAAAAHRQTRYWRDSGTLFTHAIEVTRNNFLAHEHLGIFLADKGHSTEAIEHYRQSVRINSAFGEVHNNLGVELVRVGQTREAAEHFRQAGELNPKLAAAHNNLGMLLSASGRASEAIPEFETALKLKDDGRVHLNLARALCIIGRFTEGIGEYRTALRFFPASVDILVELAGALGDSGQQDEARHECENALKINPDYQPAKEVLRSLGPMQK